MPSLLTLLLSATSLILGAGNSIERPAAPHGGVRFDPPAMIVDRDSSGFVQRMIGVYSDHGDSIRILGVNGSCSCASASVQRPLLHDSAPGKIYLQINARHFTDTLNTVLFTVNHTGGSSPSVYSVSVRCKP